jgi:hypothetical protein
MFDNYDDDYQEFWAPNIKNCISKRPNEHLKCRCWWDLRWTAGLGLRPHWTHEVSGNPVLESIEQLNIFLGDNFWRNTWWFQLKNILWDKRPYSMSSNTQCQTVEPAKKKKWDFTKQKKGNRSIRWVMCAKNGHNWVSSWIKTGISRIRQLVTVRSSFLI